MKLALVAALFASWQPAVVVEPFRLDTVQLTAGADGTVFMAAAQNLDAEDGVLERPVLSVRAAPPGGPFGAPRVVEGEAVGVDASGTPTTLAPAPRWRRAQLAVAPSGAAVVTWLEGRRLQASVRDPGGAFGAPETVARRVPRDTRITPAIGARGDALLVWTRADLYYLPGFAAVRRPGGRFTAPSQISSHIGDIRVAVGDEGTAVVAFTQSRPGDERGRTETRVFAAPPGARRFRGQTLPCSGVAALDVAPNGRRLVLCGNFLQVWEGTGRLRRAGDLGARKRFDGVSVDLASDGRAVVAWATATRDFPTGGRVVGVLRPAGGAFGPPAFLTEQFDAVTPVAAQLTADGGAVVVSETFGAGRSMLLSRGA